jgi:hypothetical protein
MKMMALQITPETYPIAVACLPGGFATIGPSQTYGDWLIINQPEAIYVGGGKNAPTVVGLGNCWCPDNMFNRDYEFVTPPKKNKFCEIVKK